MKEKSLRMLTYCYLIIPIIVFCLGWIKPIFSIPLTIGLTAIIAKKIKDNKQAIDKEECFITNKQTVAIFIVILLICITAGQGGMFYQSSDWKWRNAVFRDLINYEWPVYYEQTNTGLTYYIGFWLVPALVGKVTLQICEPIAWQVANIALLFWSATGVLITILWFIKLLKIKSNKEIIMTMLFFLGFSGLDILGIILTKYYNIHIEWWAKYFQYSSNITQLFFVFNQSIVAWIITLMFLDEEKVNNYMLIILLSIPYCPLPFLGLIPLMGVKGVSILIRYIKNKQFKEFLKDVFSVQNILGLITVLPIYLLYYGSNSGIGGSGSFGINKTFFYVFNLVLIFYFLEVGVYYLLLFKENKSKLLFVTSAIVLFFIPLFRIGKTADFAMRASIPSLIILTYYVIQYLLKHIDRVNFNVFLIVIVFIIGSITPILEYKRAFNTILEKGKINCICDDIKTFSDKSPNELLLFNFLTINPKETSIFYKYLARK